MKMGRFIPADAGNRGLTGLGVVTLPVHPRGRGEQAAYVVLHDLHDGSSPRTRGTDHAGVLEAAASRFIPADAGNSAGDHGWQ